MIINKDKLFLKCENKKDQGIERLVNISFAANEQKAFANKPEDFIFWREDFFNLQKCSVWKNISKDSQENILKKMNIHLLKEANYIEQAGMLYAAKMNLMAQTNDERSFFSIMGYEEARHLQNLKPFFKEGITESETPSFSNLIGKIIIEGDRPANLFLIQILLEGWGLNYYQSLADKSQNRELTEVFRSIIKDETRHHSAGIILLDKTQATKNSFLQDSLYELLEMVRIGPWTLINEIKNEIKDINATQIKSILTESDAINDTNQKLLRLKNLTEKSLGGDLIQFFDKNKLWSAHSLDEMSLAHS
jgi:rubrerythrin